MMVWDWKKKAYIEISVAVSGIGSDAEVEGNSVTQSGS